jgi:hypothetical protein
MLLREELVKEGNYSSKISVNVTDFRLKYRIKWNNYEKRFQEVFLSQEIVPHP